jgi:hypothetical protein
MISEGPSSFCLHNSSFILLACGAQEEEEKNILAKAQRPQSSKQEEDQTDRTDSGLPAMPT